MLKDCQVDAEIGEGLSELKPPLWPQIKKSCDPWAWGSPWSAPILLVHKKMILDLLPTARHPASGKTRGDLTLKHNTWVLWRDFFGGCNWYNSKNYQKNCSCSRCFWGITLGPSDSWAKKLALPWKPRGWDWAYSAGDPWHGVARSHQGRRGDDIGWRMALHSLFFDTILFGSVEVMQFLRLNHAISHEQVQKIAAWCVFYVDCSLCGL